METAVLLKTEKKCVFKKSTKVKIQYTDHIELPAMRVYV